jgi:hypothetical protein
MRVFISWSGDRGRAAADALAGWLPQVINALKPWVSTSGIEKGTRWSAEVAAKLEESRAGIVCLTPNSLHADWILFEAGALAKSIADTYVCTFLIGMEPSDVSGPLAQFQATKAVKQDVLKLLSTLNGALGDSARTPQHIHEAFEMWWPRLESLLKQLPDDGAVKPPRSEHAMIQEILGLVRDISRTAPAKSRDEKYMGVIRGMRSALDKIFPEARAEMSPQRIDGKKAELNVTIFRPGKPQIECLVSIPVNADEAEADALATAQLLEAKRRAYDLASESALSEAAADLARGSSGNSSGATNRQVGNLPRGKPIR